MTATLCSSYAVMNKAGARASSTIVGSSAIMEQFINQAEAVICNELRYNAVTNYGGITVDGKKAFELACSNLAAIYVVNYDNSNFISRAESETILDVLNDGYERAIKQLKDEGVKTYLGISV